MRFKGHALFPLVDKGLLWSVMSLTGVFFRNVNCRMIDLFSVVGRRSQSFNKSQLRPSYFYRCWLLGTLMFVPGSWRHFCRRSTITDRRLRGGPRATKIPSACHRDPVRDFGCNDRDRLTGEVPRQIPPRGQSLFTQHK